MIRPYMRVLPAALGNRLEEALLVADELGHQLDDEQKLALGDITSTTGDGKLAAYEAVISAPRQSGKSLVCEVYAVMHAQRGESVLYTGHRADLAGTIFRRLVATIPESWGTIATYSNGREGIEFQSGGRIVFKTRTQRVGRGDTFSKLIVDEAQVVNKDDLDGVRYALRAMGDAQILYAGTAPNGRANLSCLVLKDLRDRARAGQAEKLVYLEWSAGITDEAGEELQAHQVPEAMLADPAVWRRATPGFGARITEERMASELEAMGPESFAIEALNVPLWPDVAYAGTGPVTVAGWDALIDETSELDPEQEIAECLVAYDMSPSRTVSIVVVGRRGDGLLHADYVGRFEGAAAALSALGTILDRADIDVRAVACDGAPENLGLLQRLKADHLVTGAQTREEAASRLGQQACGTLVDLVGEGRFRHRGQRELREAVSGAVAKPLGDGWVYSRSRSRTDVSPLMAAAVALHIAEMELQIAGASAESHIY